MIFITRNFTVKAKYVVCDKIKYEKGFFTVSFGLFSPKLDGYICNCKACGGCNFELRSDLHHKKIWKQNQYDNDTIKSFNFKSKSVRISNIKNYYDYELKKVINGEDIIIFFNDKNWRKLLLYIIEMLKKEK